MLDEITGLQHHFTAQWQTLVHANAGWVVQTEGNAEGGPFWATADSVPEAPPLTEEMIELE